MATQEKSNSLCVHLVGENHPISSDIQSLIFAVSPGACAHPEIKKGFHPNRSGPSIHCRECFAKNDAKKQKQCDGFQPKS